MSNIKEKVNNLNNMILEGKILDAFEEKFGEYIPVDGKGRLAAGQGGSGEGPRDGTEQIPEWEKILAENLKKIS